MARAQALNCYGPNWRFYKDTKGHGRNQGPFSKAGVKTREILHAQCLPCHCKLGAMATWLGTPGVLSAGFIALPGQGLLTDIHSGCLPAQKQSFPLGNEENGNFPPQVLEQGLVVASPSQCLPVASRQGQNEAKQGSMQPISCDPSAVGVCPLASTGPCTQAVLSQELHSLFPMILQSQQPIALSLAPCRGSLVTCDGRHGAVTSNPVILRRTDA